MDKFIYVCILCGCDYTTNIAGIGPIKAYNYIDELGTIESVIRKIEQDNENPNKKKKYHVPETFMFQEARELFKNPSVIKNTDQLNDMVKWTKPDDNGLKEFLITSKGFSEAKVDSGIRKLKGTVSQANQSRIDCFFT